MIVQTPSATSSIGSEGMFEDETWPGFISDDIEEFVSKAVELYNDENKWNEAKNNAHTLLKSKYDGNILGKELIKKIDEVYENLEEHRLNNFTGSMLRHHSMSSTKYMSQWIAEKNKTK